MTLKDCTKAELIFVVERLQSCWLAGGDYYVRRALCDVEELRANQRREKARRLLDYASKQLQRLESLLAPYDGCRYIDIPDNVIKEASTAEKEYLLATKEWNKLMGIQ